jgi:predicted small lipoprotein YifL
MKNIFLFSMIIMSFLSLTSCTPDEIEDTIANQTVSADGGTGGQTGPLTPPPPPTKP